MNLNDFGVKMLNIDPLKRAKFIFHRKDGYVFTSFGKGVDEAFKNLGFIERDWNDILEVERIEE